MEYLTLERAPRLETSKGVRVWIIANGDKLTMILVELDEGAEVQLHSHPHEQAGYIVKGRVEFRTPSGAHILSEGMAYLVRSNEPHEVRNLGPGTAIAIEVFSPPREDFLKMAVKPRGA